MRVVRVYCVFTFKNLESAVYANKLKKNKLINYLKLILNILYSDLFGFAT